MLWTILLILFLLWAVGMIGSYTMGGLIHILLLLALGVLAIRLIQGRRVVSPMARHDRTRDVWYFARPREVAHATKTRADQSLGAHGMRREGGHK